MVSPGPAQARRMLEAVARLEAVVEEIRKVEEAWKEWRASFL